MARWGDMATVFAIVHCERTRANAESRTGYSEYFYRRCCQKAMIHLELRKLDVQPRACHRDDHHGVGFASEMDVAQSHEWPKMMTRG